MNFEQTVSWKSIQQFWTIYSHSSTKYPQRCYLYIYVYTCDVDFFNSVLLIYSKMIPRLSGWLNRGHHHVIFVWYSLKIEPRSRDWHPTSSTIGVTDTLIDVLGRKYLKTQTKKEKLAILTFNDKFDFWEMIELYRL